MIYKEWLPRPYTNQPFLRNGRLQDKDSIIGVHHPAETSRAKEVFGEIEFSSIEDGIYIAKHPVTQKQYQEFVITRYPVTEKQYQEFYETKNRNLDSHPIVNVSWNDALAFCEWLSGNIGTEVRLPTEDEWAKAAKYLNVSTNYSYPWGQKPENPKSEIWEWSTATSEKGKREPILVKLPAHHRIPIEKKEFISPDLKDEAFGFRVVLTEGS